MSNMKCPFCQQELETWAKYTDGTSKVWCSKCNLFGDSKLFSELIRTRKALDVAIRRLDQMTWGCDSTDAEYLLKEIKEITALEQKEHFADTSKKIEQKDVK